VVLLLTGRFDVKLPQFVCEQCCNVCVPTVESVVSSGYWPSSAVISSGGFYSVMYSAVFSSISGR